MDVKSNKIYAVECIARNVNVEFYINDIPISLRGPGLGSFWGGPINQYLINKKNKISMLIRPGDSPSLAKTGLIPGNLLTYPEENESALMRLCAYPIGALLGGPETEELVRISWPEKREIKKNLTINDYELNSYPLLKEEKFNVGNIFSLPKTWQKASTVKLNERTKLSIAKFIEELYSCIEKGEVDKFIEFTFCRIKDNANSYKKNIEDNISLIKEGFKRNLSSESWKLAKLDPQSYDFRICGNNKIVHCVAKDWKSIIREVPDETNSLSYYDIFISYVKRNWQVVL